RPSGDQRPGGRHARSPDRAAARRSSVPRPAVAGRRRTPGGRTSVAATRTGGGSGMISAVSRRLAHALAVVLGVTVLVFIITRVVGDPARAMLPLSATDEQRAQYERSL